MSAVLEVVEVALAVARALESIGVDYALGGSVATSLQGEPRSTNDIDFRMGGETSDRQWRDVLGLLRVSGGSLDLAYLRHWAKLLGVEDLLERALASKLDV
jgi:hypothetical protein